MTPNSKTRATDDEILMLIRLRRSLAKEAFHKVVTGFVAFPLKVPSARLLLDYLLNMVSCLELMLKLLSGDWRSHNVAEMYKKAFGCEHSDPEFMTRLKEAIVDQKYLIEPASSIAHNLPELEALFYALRTQITSKYRTYSVQIEYNLPKQIGEFLRDTAELYYHRSGLPGENIESGQAAYRGDVDRIKANIDKFLSFNNDKFTFHLDECSITDA